MAMPSVVALLGFTACARSVYAEVAEGTESRRLVRSRPSPEVPHGDTHLVRSQVSVAVSPEGVSPDIAFSSDSLLKTNSHTAETALDPVYDAVGICHKKSKFNRCGPCTKDDDCGKRLTCKKNKSWQAAGCKAPVPDPEEPIDCEAVPLYHKGDGRCTVDSLWSTAKAFDPEYYTTPPTVRDETGCPGEPLDEALAEGLNNVSFPHPETCTFRAFTNKGFRGSNCESWCKSKGMKCAWAQDNAAGGCKLDDSDIAPTEQYGCLQAHKNQVCGCIPAKYEVCWKDTYKTR